MGYMHDDPRYPRFFTYLSLFCFSMLGLVASANVFMIFIFWELVGVCSYLLIGFWYEEKKNADAANKAFVVNRVGDVGMLVGLGLLWTSLGTFDIDDDQPLAPRRDGHASTSARPADARHGRRRSFATRRPGQVLQRRAATGRAAGRSRSGRLTPGRAGDLRRLRRQERPVPAARLAARRDGRPDAGLGPDPRGDDGGGGRLPGRAGSSRSSPPTCCSTSPTPAAITLFIAASIAMVQTDYKKVLAYSTVSQLGFMMLGLGVGGWAAGLFHLLDARVLQGPALPRRRQRLPRRAHLRDAASWAACGRKMPITAYTMLAGDAGDLGRAAVQRVLLQGRHPRLGAVPRLRARAASTSCFPAAGRRRRDDGVLHVPALVPDLRRRAAGYPGRGARPRPRHGHDAPSPRPPGRPRPRERAVDDAGRSWSWRSRRSSSAGPGGSARLRSCRSASRSWSRCWPTASRSRRWTWARRTCWAMGASILIATVGHRAGLPLLRAPGRRRRRFEPAAGGRAVRRRLRLPGAQVVFRRALRRRPGAADPVRWPGWRPTSTAWSSTAWSTARPA